MEKSETTPNESSAGIQKPTSSQIEDVLKIFGGEQETQEEQTSESSESEEATDESPKKEVAKPRSLADLAERLQVEVSELYDIEIPSAQDGGESQTLGALKDLKNDYDSFEVNKLAFEEDRVQREKEYTQKMGELQEILKAVPKQYLSENVVKAAQQQYEQRLAEQRELVPKLIPEWKDESVAKQDLGGIAEHLEAYFGKGALDLVNDARMLKYMRDNWQREVRINKALESVRKKQSSSKPAQPSRSTVKKQQNVKSRQMSGPAKTRQQTAEVSELLRGLTKKR